jgi:hypothetical protein
MHEYLMYFAIQKAYHNFPEDTSQAILFRGMLSINDRYLIKIVGAILQKIPIFVLGPHLKGS